MIRLVAVVVASAVISTTGQQQPVRGLTAVQEVARVYDAIVDADFDAVLRVLPATCGEGRAPIAVCHVLHALTIWWDISLDPNGRRLDAQFSIAVERAIRESDHWVKREPQRAEAWFYLGAAYGARVQWRVLRRERLAAARDGKRIKESLERALAIDPTLHDAQFGLGLYRYYADVAPAALKMVRWLLMLPGGDRRDGLQRIVTARAHGQLVRSEADFQLHLIYLWYEKQFSEALTIVKALQQRHPRNPLFLQLESEIHDIYFHDARASLTASRALLQAAEQRRVHRSNTASVAARLNIATQLARLGEADEAMAILAAIVDARPTAPHGATTRAEALLKQLRTVRR